MRAYDEIYLNDAKRILASAFDYVKNSCLIELNRFLELFITSGYASKFELGNPSVITGMSGEELVRSIHYKVYGIDVLPEMRRRDPRPAAVLPGLSAIYGGIPCPS